MVKPGSSMGMPSKIKLEEPESSSSSEDVEEMEQALADVTFGELQKARSNGSHVVHRSLSIHWMAEAEIRKKRLVEKYKQLKASGKLKPFIEKRRRKNAAKDHRYMPYRRPDATE